MASEFVHLHAHSEYSLLDGLGRIGDLVHSAAALGMPALALTDHGTMFGAIEFYSKAREAGVKPIIGCEVYVADRALGEPAGADATNYHLVLLAENETGYRNLIRLTTEARLRGFYRKPRVDRELLASHAEGLVCLSACASGEIASRILEGDLAAAEICADWYRQTFKDRYYLEMQYHDLEFQRTINQGVLHLSQKLGLPLVATNDVHYVEARHAETHEILLCVQTQTTLSDPKRMKLGSDQFFLKSAQEMESLFGQFPGAVSHTLDIAERCNLDIKFGRSLLPNVEIPPGQTAASFLRTLCNEGLRIRYGEVQEAARERLEYELSVIEKTGFVEYFLLVYDVIRFARESGIGVGPGRGSGAGSLVAYVLFVTNVDPIAHGLSFERFLNPERVTMPDMDLDFADDRRDEVIRYVTERYGRDRVAQIITFGTIGPRAGVRDVGRVLGMSYPDVDRVAKLIPPLCNKVAQAKEDVPELKQLYEGDPAMQRLLDAVENLEGVARHASTHAAGVVISREPLAQHVPLYKVPKTDQVVTQYAMGSIEKIGLLKMDFLGLRTLTILQRACAFVEQSTGDPLRLDDIPLDDPSIYRLLSSGDTFGVFQVDGEGMRKLLIKLEPSQFEHIVAVNALYRPGPMEQIDVFVERRHGRAAIKYIHPALEEVLAPTFGTFVYQEQVMQLFKLVAGYSLGEADLVRKAMGKKKPEELAKHRAIFLERAEERGTPRAVAQELWDLAEPFAGYAFNKSHAAAYTVLTCQTAYLKANYPREYLAGLLSSDREDTDKVALALRECRRLGVRVHPPDINDSDLDFTLEGDGIRFGLGAIKHVGTGTVECVLEARRGGRFSSLEDFARRLDWRAVNKRALEGLIKCGAMDSLGVERGKLVHNLDAIASFGTHIQRSASAGPSLFGEVDEPEAVLPLQIADPAPPKDRLAWEEEHLGYFVSPHPLAAAEASFADLNIVPVSSLSADDDNQTVRAGGMMQRTRSFSTKDGRPMATLQLAGLEGSVDVVVFSRGYEQLQSKIVEGAIVALDGKVDASDGHLRLIASAIWSIEEAATRPLRAAGDKRANSNGNGNGNGHAPPALTVPAAPPSRRLEIELVRTDDREADLQRVVAVFSVLQRHPGNDEVDLFVRNGSSKARSVPLPHRYVAYSDGLRAEVESILGDGTVVVRGLHRAA